MATIVSMGASNETAYRGLSCEEAYSDLSREWYITDWDCQEDDE